MVEAGSSKLLGLDAVAIEPIPVRTGGKLSEALISVKFRRQTPADSLVENRGERIGSSAISSRHEGLSWKV